VTDERWSEVDRYIDRTFAIEDAALRDAVAAGKAAGLPEIQVSAAHGRFLHVLALAIGARRVLEIGTLFGYSGIHLARALPPDGRLVTLELDPKHAEVARASFARAGVADRVELRLGRAAESLAALAAERAAPFDLVFIDADKPGYPEYLEGALRLARRGTVIVADNVVRRGAVADASSEDANVRAVRRYNEAVARDPRLRATVLQTVGAKGYDGMAIAVVTATA
jgi:predicted O-methyltransferase YrrM